MGDGTAALLASEKEPFDLVLMDVLLPDITGLEVTARIRRREAAAGLHTPIIAITADVMKGDMEHCLAAGMDAYLAKPFTEALLLDVIEETMSRLKPSA